MKSSDWLLSATASGVVYLYIRADELIGAGMLFVILAAFWVSKWVESWKPRTGEGS